MFRSLNSSPMFRFISARQNSTLVQLSQAIKTTSANKATKSNKDSKDRSVISDVDHLLLSFEDTLKTNGNASSSSTSTPGSSKFTSSDFRARSSNYLLQQPAPHPRDVAKNVRMFGPLAGRTLDVRMGQNVGNIVGGLATLVRTNKVRFLKTEQARFIGKAKLQKQKHRQWWRRNFSAGFKELMSQVRDAKRRGY